MIRKAERKHDLPIKLNQENLEEKCVVTVTQCLPDLKSSSYISVVPSVPNSIANYEKMILYYPQNSSTS